MRLDIEKVHVASLYSDNRLFKIPRYQRDYTWEDKQTTQMFEDIFKTLMITEIIEDEEIDKIAFEETGKNVQIDDYLLGNIILDGEIKNSRNQVIEVIDGQQRITSIMIFYAALLTRLRSFDSESKFFSDIEEVIDQIEALFYQGRSPKRMALTKETTSDFFEEFIYKMIIKEEIAEEEIIYIANKENVCIKNAYDNFYNKLSKQSIISGDFSVFAYEYLLLKIFDQLQNATLVLISSNDSKIVNTIFESYNSKGKSLDPIDLIKNNVFQVLSEYPHEEAKPKWAEVKNNLVMNKVNQKSSELEIIQTVDLDQFFLHFWNSNYKNVTEKRLYQSFLQVMEKAIDDDNSEEMIYRNFLSEMANYSEIYGHIINSSSMGIFSLENKTEVENLLQYINKINIVQVRVVLLQLMYGVKERFISEKVFLNLLRSIVHFHYMFSAIGSIRANKFANYYKNFAINLKQCFNTGSKNEIDKLQKGFIRKLNEYLEDNSAVIRENLYDMKLCYCSEDSVKKMTLMERKALYVTKYLLYFIAYQKTGKFIPNMTIEHLIPASKKSENKRFLFGNLGMLEKILNEECDDKELKDKLLIYKKSSNLDIKKVQEELDIDRREKELLDYVLSCKLK